MDRGACFEQFAVSFGDVERAYVLLTGPWGGCLSTFLKVWKLHWRDRTGQDAFCYLMVLKMFQFTSFSVLC